jgi:uncharacterized membrane protein YobD (UPF0266 family)
MEVKYSVTKKQIMRRYFTRWQQSLWKSHLFIFIVVFYMVYSSRIMHNSDGLTKIAIAILAGLLPIAILPLIPMIFHKSNTRVLLIEPDGIETTIGNKHAKIPWSKIRNVQKDNEFIFVTGTNNNEFMIPLSAFNNHNEMNLFFSKLSGKSAVVRPRE